MKKRLLSMLLVLCMVLQYVPVGAAAYGPGELCEHHTWHDESCGYQEEIWPQDCMHVCGEECQGEMEGMENCSHMDHDAECGYQEGQAGTPCGYVCEICQFGVYCITIEGVENGHVMTDMPEYREMETVIVYPNPADGYRIESVTVTDATDSMIDCVQDDGGNFWFSMPASDVTITAVFVEIGCAHTFDAGLYHPAEEGHYLRCDNCEYYDEFALEAHMDADKDSSCDKCGAMVDNTCSEHSYVPTVTDPNCVDGGYTTYVCSACDDTYVDAYTEALGHDYQGETCARCGEATPDDHVIASGTAGDEITWEITHGGTLTITGTGPMKNCGNIRRPWDEYESVVKKVIIGEGVTDIGTYAFYQFQYLEEVEIPSTVTAIGDLAFNWCKRLKSIKLPEGLKTINWCGISYCKSLEEITIPGSVTFMGVGALAGCTNIKEIQFLGDAPRIGTPPPNSGVPFLDITATAYYPANNATWTIEVMDALGGDITWVCAACKNGHTEMVDPAKKATCLETGLTEGKHCSVCGRVLMAQEVIPLAEHDWKVTYVNNHDNTHTASFVCKNDDSHTKDSVTEKHTYGENGCIYCDETEIQGTCGEKLTWVLDAGGTLTISGEGAMYNYSLANPAPWNAYQSRIKSLVIAHGATAIGSYAFYGCAGLTSVLIPDSVVSIGVYAFAYCSNLKNVALPDSVTDLDDTIWIGTGVGSLVIGGKPVTSLENYQGLKEIRFRGDFRGISENAFKNVVATAYYPGNNDTWTADKLQNYGGLITWKPYGHDELEIIRQPEDVQQEIGKKFAVTVEAKGEKLQYQWYYKDSGMKGFKVSSNKRSSYAYTMQSYMHNRQVYCVITDKFGNTVNSETATITRPPVELKILQQPQNVEVEIGQKYSVKPTVQGDGLKYQWYYKNAGGKAFSVSSNKSSAYAYTMQSYMHNRQVYCVITDQYGSSVTTDTVTITRPPVEMKLLQQPQDVEVEIGQKFSVKPTAQGDGLKYQWYYKDSGMKEFKVSSNKSSAYAYTMQSYMHNRQVYCVITDQYGSSVTTDTATITRPPMELKILAQPTDAYAAKGEKFSIKPSVQGDGLKYQWYYKDSGMKEFKVSSNKSSAYAYSMQSYMNNRSVYCVITDQYGAQVQTDAVTIHIR